MSSEIKSYVSELEKIIEERKKIKLSDKKLKDRQTYLEKKIENYLDTKNQPGLKNKTIAITKEEKETHRRGKKKDKEEDALKFLRDQGVRNPEETLKNLLSKMKGDVEYKTILKIRKIKEEKNV